MNAQLRIAAAGGDAVSHDRGTRLGAGSGVPRVRVGESPPVSLALLERLDVAVVIVVLFACLLVYQEPLTLDYATLGVVAAIVASRCITPPDLRGTVALGTAHPVGMTRLVVEWGTSVSLLLLAGFAFKVSDWYSRSVLLTWFAATPAALIGVQRFQLRAARWLHERGASASRFVVVGANQVGLELARRLPAAQLLGFFDFRGADRLAELGAPVSLLGHCRGLGDFVRSQGVSAVYIALPITNAPRIKALLADLRNSTASVYFVPDVFAFDLIQARVVDLNGMPALAVCDTPLRGTNALSKRAVDIALAATGLVVLAPVLVALAIAIRLGSPGPALFKQRRYGLAGEEIVVYKFRSMTVAEDGTEVRQASLHDSRVTRIGRFIRRTSLDELPQLVNVLEGKMSLVGPRPHAIAHNELYRRQISGYMLRHKVRPGITGWAQVHGLRGETDTIDKMEQRVRYDLEYLSNWSLLLDLRILLRTVVVVLRGRNAY